MVKIPIKVNLLNIIYLSNDIMCFLELCRSFKQARFYGIIVHGCITDTELFKSQGSSFGVMMCYRLDGQGTGF
jgi:hypothetical protein